MQNLVLCFPCDTSTHNVSRITSILRAGLEKTTRQRPYLAGRLDREETGPKAGRLKLTYPSSENVGITFSVNSLNDKPNVWRASYEDLRRLGMPISQLDPKLLVPPGGFGRLESYPIAAQANFVPGGCLLNVCLHHSFVDGISGAMLVGVWAHNCKELSQQENATPEASYPQAMSWQLRDIADPYQARSDVTAAPAPLELPDILQDITAPTGSDITRIQDDDTLWRLLGLKKPTAEPLRAWPNPPTSTLVSAIFSASSASILRLKRASAPSSSSVKVVDGEQSLFISSFDAMAALLWRCILRARHPDLTSPDLSAPLSSCLRIPISLRSALGISPSYPGNLLLNATTSLPLSSILPSTLTVQAQTALQIRASSIFSRDASRILDAIKLSFVLPDPTSRRPLLPSTTEKDLVITTWEDLPYYQQEWGTTFGLGDKRNAEFVRVPRGLLGGVCVVLPRRSGKDGQSLEAGLEVMVSLETEQMERLKADAEFGQYFELAAL